jgi:hypothetical protein
LIAAVKFSPGHYVLLEDEDDDDMSAAFHPGVWWAI